MAPVSYTHLTGEALFARAMCHENDHLDGHVIRDRADRLYTEAEIDLSLIHI